MKLSSLFIVIPKKSNSHVTNHSIIWDLEQRVWQGHWRRQRAHCE